MAVRVEGREAESSSLMGTELVWEDEKVLEIVVIMDVLNTTEIHA